MKKQVLLLFFAISSAFFAFSQSSVWEISKGKKKIYIGGSIHLLRPSDYPLPKEFDAAFQKADVLVFEADIDKLSSAGAANQFMSKMTYTDGKTLKSVLSEKTYIALEDKLLSYPIPMRDLEKLKPSMAILTLTAVNMSHLGITADGVDKYYYDKAKKAKKRIQYLEAVDYQIDLLSKTGDGIEDDFVMYSLNELKTVENNLSLLISAWRKGSTTLITSQILEMQQKYPELYQTILAQRNRQWLTKIENLVKENNHVLFIIVGEAHLHGTDGLLNLLIEKEYKVKQFK